MKNEAKVQKLLAKAEKAAGKGTERTLQLRVKAIQADRKASGR